MRSSRWLPSAPLWFHERHVACWTKLCILEFADSFQVMTLGHKLQLRPLAVPVIFGLIVDEMGLLILENKHISREMNLIRASCCFGDGRFYAYLSELIYFDNYRISPMTGKQTWSIVSIWQVRLHQYYHIKRNKNVCKFAWLYRRALYFALLL